MVTALDDIAGLVEEAAASMYGKNWNSPGADKRPGEKMKDVWRGYARDGLAPILPRLHALSEENKRLREEASLIENRLTDALAAERNAAARAEVQVRELRAALEPFAMLSRQLQFAAAEDDEIELGGEALRPALDRARATLKSTEPTDAA